MDGAPASETLGSRVGWYAAWLMAGPFAVLGTWYAIQVGLGYDSHAYWSAVQDMDHLYDAPALSRDAYLYSPLFAQAVWPLGRLPWPVFGIVWSVLLAAVFVWLLGPLPTKWFLPALVATVPEILTGNIYALMAGALVLGVSRGTPWLLLGFTKVTPGLVGVAWLVAGRRWRALLTGIAVGAVLGGVSYAVNPSSWQQWFRFLTSGSAGTLGRSAVPWVALSFLAVALLIAVVAAVTRRPWLLPVATILASPTFGPNTLTLLAAAVRLKSPQPTESPGATSSS